MALQTTYIINTNGPTVYIPIIRDTTMTMTCSPTRTAFPANRVLLMLCKVWFIVSGFLKLVSLRGLCEHKFRNFYNMQYFFCVFLSHKRVLLYRFCKNVVQRVSYARFCGCKSYRLCRFIASIAGLENVVCTYMFQQKMEGLTVVVMTQVTEFMQQDIVAKDRRQTHNVQIKVDIVP